MIDMYIRFEVFTFTHYLHTKGNAKCRNWGGFGYWPFNRAHTTSSSTLTIEN